MSKLKLTGSLFALTLLAGCSLSTLSGMSNTDVESSDTASQTYWLDYALTQCNTAPWGKTTEPAIVTEYFSTTITIFAVEVTPPAAGQIFCSACGCPTGTVVSIQTDIAGQTYLLEQGFTAEGEALDGATLTDPTTPTVATETVVPATSTVVNPDATVAIDVPTEPTVEAPSTESNTNAVGVAETVEDVDPAVVVEDDPNTTAGQETTELSEADANLKDRAEQVEAALVEYYSRHGSYPDDLAVLQLSVELTGITYTPIGALPASYYDLAIAYTTGAEILNP